MCICLYVEVHGHAYVCVDVNEKVSMCPGMCRCVRVYMCAYVDADMCMCRCTGVCM